jgi:hypothetical protein
MEKGLKHALKELDQPDVDPDYALKAAITGATVIEKIGEDDSATVSPQEQQRYERMQRRLLRVGYLLGSTGVGPLGLRVLSPADDHNPLGMELGDNGESVKSEGDTTNSG